MMRLILICLLLVLPVRAARVDLAWKDNSTTESGFKVERATNGGSYGQIATVAANVTAYTDGAVSTGTDYSYRVRAYDSSTNSPYSNVASVSIPGTVNEAPIISNIADTSIVIGGNTTISFTIGDAETAASSLTVSAVSSNTSLIPDSNLVLGGSGANRNVKVTPVANQGGESIITVSVSDGTSTTTTAFSATVASAGYVVTSSGDGFKSTALSSVQSGSFQATFDATPSASSVDALVGLSKVVAADYPDLAVIIRFNSNGTFDARNGTSYTSDATINYGAGTVYHFRVVVNVLARTFSVYVKSTGAEQLLAANYAFRSEQSSVTSLNYWVAETGPSPAGVTLTTGAFAITTNNTPPTISNITDKTTQQNTPVVVNFTVGDAETAAASLTVSGSSSNQTLVPNANIVFGGSGTNRTATITPVGFGSAAITISVSDGTVSASDSFNLAVTQGVFAAPTGITISTQ